MAKSKPLKAEFSENRRKGFIIYQSSTYEEGKTYINLFGRDENNNTFLIKKRIQTVFFYQKKG